MYIEISDRLLKNVQEITNMDYEVLKHRVAYVDGLGNLVTEITKIVPIEIVTGMIEDLVLEYHNLVEKNEDLKQDVAENYELKKDDPYKEYGINEDSFH